MASTKQRQQAAKLARKQNNQKAKVCLVQNKVNQQLATLPSKVTFNKCVPNTTDCYDMFMAWRADYIASGDMAAPIGSIHSWLRMANSRIWHKIMYEGQVAGILIIEAGHGSSNEVEIVYVKPEFRGLGISTITYVYAQKHHNCVSVSLTNHRITGQCAYWTRLGYKSAMLVNNTQTDPHGLAVIRTDDKGVPLDEETFRLYRKKTVECNKAIAKAFA